MILNFGKLRLFQANTVLHLWSLSNQSKIWKLLISLHRFLFSVADVFLGYWIILVSKCSLPLQMRLELYQFFLCYTKFISVFCCFVCSLWLFVAQNYVYSRHIIQYVKYYPILRKHDIFLSKTVAVEAPTHSLGL